MLPFPDSTQAEEMIMVWEPEVDNFAILYQTVRTHCTMSCPSEVQLRLCLLMEYVVWKNQLGTFGSSLRF